MYNRELEFTWFLYFRGVMNAGERLWLLKIGIPQPFPCQHY